MPDKFKEKYREEILENTEEYKAQPVNDYEKRIPGYIPGWEDEIIATYPKKQTDQGQNTTVYDERNGEGEGSSDENGEGNNEEDSDEGDPGDMNFPTDEEIDSQVEEAGARAKVSFMDPDFVFFLILAVIVDIVSIALAMFAILVIPELIQMGLSAVAALVFGWWMKKRTGRIAASKEEQRQKIIKAIEKQKEKLAKYQKMGKLSPKAYDRYMQSYGKQMGKQGKLAAKTLARSPAGKIALRVGLAFLGKVSVILAVIPMWTISVVLMLKEE
jgi:hypothetical protein